jgi:hypothetical protein
MVYFDMITTVFGGAVVGSVFGRREAGIRRLLSPRLFFLSCYDTITAIDFAREQFCLLPDCLREQFRDEMSAQKHLMAKLCGAFWLLDIIVASQIKKRVRKVSFQVWKLIIDPKTKSAMVICTDGNGKELEKRELDYTNFPLDEGIELWMEDDVIYLPSEH